MQLQDSDWEHLQRHVSLGYYGAPRAVYQAVAALVNPADITGSWPAFKQGDPSAWLIWVVTDTAIAYAEIQFAAANYTIQEEDNRAHLSTPVDFEILQAWSRPLSRVAKLQVGRVGHRGLSDWYPVEGITLTFDDGEALIVPGQDEAGTRPDGRQRSDQFIAAIRAGLSF